MLEQAYNNSLYTLSVYNDNSLVGIIRVVGDGHSIIYIQDIIVHTDYQKKGIGTTLINKVLDKYSNVYQTVLLTDNKPSTVSFYESIGLKTSNKYGCISFVRYNM